MWINIIKKSYKHYQHHYYYYYLIIKFKYKLKNNNIDLLTTLAFGEFFREFWVWWKMR